jgi:nucleoporin GLE1
MKDTFSPRVSVNDYLPASQTLPDPAPTVPSLAIYLLSILAKTVISVTITSCLDNPRAGEAPALLAVQIFATPDFTFPSPPTPTKPNNTVSLISILIAKYHAAAPPLFGVSGSEKTQKSRLGWRTTEDPSTGRKAYVPEQQQYDRLVGLAAGYAAISLRNFSKSRNQNPFPPKHFWASLGYIVNTPPEQVQVTHLLLLKSLLEGSVERVVQFWGATGVAALRLALVVFPERLPGELRSHSTAKALGVLREKWARDMRFHLT